MIEEILPPLVAVAEAFGDVPDTALYPEEAVLANAMAPGRRREFATGRWCVRRALSRLGLPAAAVMPGPNREPQWPAGVVGSVTHCAGYRAAALAHARDVLSIGVDAEPHEPLPAEVGALVIGPEERAGLAGLTAAMPGVCWDRLVFSAKESVYKTWYPLTRRWLDFPEASVAFSPADGTFAARLLVPGPMVNGRPLTRLEGRWLVCGDLLATAIVLHAGS